MNETWNNGRPTDEVQCGPCRGRGVDKRGHECPNCYGDGTVLLAPHRTQPSDW